MHYNPVPAALGFAQEYGVPILIVVCDNRSYASQAWNVHRYFGDGTAVRTGNFIGDVIAPTPDYAKLAEAYGPLDPQAAWNKTDDSGTIDQQRR